MWVLTWWLIPIGATLLAIVVMAVLDRAGGPGPGDRSVEQFQRFQSAMQQQVRAAQHDRSHDEAGEFRYDAVHLRRR